MSPQLMSPHRCSSSARRLQQQDAASAAKPVFEFARVSLSGCVRATHISAGFLAGLVEWLDGSCRVRVEIADNGETALPGTIYFPAEQTHLPVDKSGRLVYSYGAPVDGHKLSVSVAFELVARSCGHSSVSVLLPIAASKTRRVWNPSRGRAARPSRKMRRPALCSGYPDRLSCAARRSSCCHHLKSRPFCLAFAPSVDPL